MLLTESDVGSDFSLSDQGTPGDYINHVTFEARNAAAGDWCIYSDEQVLQDSNAARDAFELARERTTNAAAHPELDTELLTPTGLIDSSFATHHAVRTKPVSCRLESGGPGSGYIVDLYRSNVFVNLQVWSANDEGPSRAVLLAKTAAERIESTLTSK